MTIYNYKIGLAISFLLISSNTKIYPLHFTGLEKPPVEIIPSKDSELDKIYVVENLKGVSIIFQEGSHVEASCRTFGNLGAAFSEYFPSTSRNGIMKIENLPGNCGFILDTGTRQYSFWLVDYSNYVFNPSTLTPSSDKNCESTILNFIGECKPIYYYSMTGKREIIDREIILEYDNIIYDEDERLLDIRPQKSTFKNLESTLHITPPVFCKTQFILSGDRFQKEWDDVKILQSGIYTPNAVYAIAFANQINGTYDNILKSDITGVYGGSAPLTLDFSSLISEGVTHIEWQISRGNDFGIITHRLNLKDMSFTFHEPGDYYVRLMVSNSSGDCVYYTEPFAISIGESELKIPNIFSPDGDGINDIWKVSYRSLSEFDCHIFDRYGKEVCHYTDLSSGWDGLHNGKQVAPGVYYYVITATGTDGKRYKKSGDINILNPRSSNER